MIGQDLAHRFHHQKIFVERESCRGKAAERYSRDGAQSPASAYASVGWPVGRAVKARLSISDDRSGRGRYSDFTASTGRFLHLRSENNCPIAVKCPAGLRKAGDNVQTRSVPAMDIEPVEIILALVSVDPDGGPRLGRGRQKGGFAPFQRFFQRTDPPHLLPPFRESAGAVLSSCSARPSGSAANTYARFVLADLPFNARPSRRASSPDRPSCSSICAISRSRPASDFWLPRERQAHPGYWRRAAATSHPLY